ncbi:putative FBD-associated F-box protein At1g61330 [Silene latifolia]|uniref:putative FBD-associated F-box protein At1g61330 n=1 Tax=Silene latifolia TaxID=37657 RepID=UPI003D76F808
MEKVVIGHLDSSIDEFRVVFDLDTSFQSRIDHWVVFALRKRVKTLELDFQPVIERMDTDYTRGGLFIDYSNSLASLSLNFVNITSEIVDSILLSCPFLENLHIRKSIFLTSIKSQSSSLKQLDVSHCDKLQTIDISAPNMVFFKYFGQPIELNIRNAVSLSSLFIGAGTGLEITYAFEPMSKYFSQLEFLYLQISLGCSFVPPVSAHLHLTVSSAYNLGVEHLKLPLLTRLKVLDLYITGDHSVSLLGWTPLIEACPVLEKLTVKFNCIDYGVNRFISKRNGSALKSLKTLEIFGYCGRRIDIELASFVIENAINLQRVVVDVYTFRRKLSIPKGDPIRIDELKKMIPEDVTFMLTEDVQ